MVRTYSVVRDTSIWDEGPESPENTSYDDDGELEAATINKVRCI